MGDIPRVDVLRKQLATVADLLEQVRRELDDLHAIAYERHRRTPDMERVHVSVTDWSLDRNGDPRARRAYRRLAGATLATFEPIDAAARDVVRILREGERPGRAGVRIASVAEVAEAIAAQARRAARGEYTPVRVERQPDP